jgi:bacterioferritin
MKGIKEVIELLNEVLAGELVAINQYFLHSKMCQNWGFTKLGAHARGESIDEMKHADKLTDRILLLDGLPNFQRLDKINIGQTVPEQMRADLALEMHAIKRLNNGIAMCRERGDNGTEALLREILISEEEHVDWIETQLRLIEHLGEVPYLAEQM